MDIRPLRDEGDYRAALTEVSALVDTDPVANTPEGDRLEWLAILIGRYEDEFFPLDRLGR
jgi:HTH-type transcriptional regulator / antitoxin HigA